MRGQHKNKKIKTCLCRYCVQQCDMVGIGVSERLSANQRALYAYANHVLTEHSNDISIRRKPMVMSQPFPL